MIKKVDHITINAADEESSMHFYRDILEMTPGEVIDMGDHKLTYLSLPAGVKLELITYKENTGQAKTQETSRGIYRHLALQTDRLEELYEAFLREGIIVTLPPAYNERLKSLRMLAKDPNGVELEFIEYEEA